MSGAIGGITAVDFRWHLDRVHGADYFRRWHRYKAKSGGLLVHKSTHHFDLLNWWLGDDARQRRCPGQRAFYTPATAAELGLAGHAPRCRDCPLPCDFRLDIAADPALRALYLEAEGEDGYLRDRCVFDADIDIEDTMQLLVGYAGGASADLHALRLFAVGGPRDHLPRHQGRAHATGTSRCTASSAASAT